MAVELSDLFVRVADAGDVGTIAALRAVWSASVASDPDFEARIANWADTEGERRTIWLAMLADLPVGMASLFEFRRMPRPALPDSLWGYVSNVFVREEFRNRGIGTALLKSVITAADERGYARLVVSPSQLALSLYRRAGFVCAADAGDDRLLVRSGRPGGHRTPVRAAP